MLVIREEQIRAFIAADEDELREAVIEAVRETNPQRVADYSDGKLGAMCDIAIARARLHDLTKPEDLAAFSAVMFETSPQFDEHPEIKTVLRGNQLSPAERFYQLFERVSEADWAVAEWSYDESEWFGTEPDAKPLGSTEKPQVDDDAKFLELNYAQLAAEQTKVVEELRSKLAETPSDKLESDLERQLDKLRFFENAYQWEPRERAKAAALNARRSVLGRAMI